MAPIIAGIYGPGRPEQVERFANLFGKVLERYNQEPVKSYIAEDRSVFLTTTSPAAIARQDGTHVVAQARLDSSSMHKVDDPIAGNPCDTTPIATESPPRRLARLLKNDSIQALEGIDGDFAGAAFFESSKRLLLFRDRFGVAPLYLATASGTTAFSNVPWLLHQGLQLDLRPKRSAIVDFLLLGANRDLESTSCEAITMLPPATAARVTNDSSELISYWSLRPQPITRTATGGELTARFLSLLETASADRLAPGRTAVAMSGGLDSTHVALAATRAASSPSDIVAITHQQSAEFPFAKTVATQLGMTLVTGPEATLDAELKFDGAAQTMLPNPSSGLPKRETHPLTQEQLNAPRVVLTGHGGDPGFAAEQLYATRLLKRKRLDLLFFDWFRHLLERAALPPLFLRTNLGGHQSHWKPRPPSWIDSGLRKDFDLVAILAEQRPQPSPDDGERARALATLRSPFWPRLFESLHPHLSLETGLDVRHPFFDRRVVEFLLSLPTLPWCTDKWLARRAGQARLPRAITERPKATVPGVRGHAEWLRGVGPRLDWLLATPDLGSFVDTKKLDTVLRQASQLRGPEIAMVCRPLQLALWLRHNGSGYERNI